MARIELKNSTIRFRDGFSNTAAIDGVVADGDDNMDIDTLGTNGVIPVSSIFTVVGSSKKYTVTETDAAAELFIDLDDASAGTYTITIGGQTTATIAFGALNAAILTAINDLSNIEPGDVSVVGPTAGEITVKIVAGQYKNTAVVMSADLSGLTATAETSSQTRPGGVTNNISFTPDLATADGIPADGATITFGGRSCEVKVGDGNLEFTEHRQYEYDLDRGLLDTVRQGDEVPIDVSLDFVWENLTALEGADTPTISDVLHRRGPAADWVSASADPCEPFCLDVEIEYVPPCGESGTEYITLPDFRWEDLPHSIGDAQVSMTGRCNATEALVSRAA